MTNELIILENSIRLAEEGVLKFTGKVFTSEDAAGNVQTFREVEPIHTFNGWKERGFSVRKGEKARCSFVIWKHVWGKAKDGDGDGESEEAPRGKMIMKRAAFFTAEQVQRIAE